MQLSFPAPGQLASLRFCTRRMDFRWPLAKVDARIDERPSFVAHPIGVCSLLILVDVAGTHSNSIAGIQLGTLILKVSFLNKGVTSF